jgi:hypothetical protein
MIRTELIDGPERHPVERPDGVEGIELIGADLVEVNPLYDPTQVTAIAASFLALDPIYLMTGAS